MCVCVKEREREREREREKPVDLASVVQKLVFSCVMLIGEGWVGGGRKEMGDTR